MNPDLISLLSDVESRENDGRGVQCVKCVITYLKARKLEDAEATVNWDHDKIRQYPEIQSVLAHIFPKYKEWLQRPGELLHNRGE